MKGVVLAGGLGNRLKPLTLVTNKHLLPVYDKPMIFYPIQTLVDAGITEIAIVVGSHHGGDFIPIIKNGKDLGLKNVEYLFQEGEGGIPDALKLAEDFADGGPITVILGDNTTDANIKDAVRAFTYGGTIFLKEVKDPQRFGVATIDANGKVVKIIEKPSLPESNFAVTGLYIYDNTVFEKIRNCVPSQRGELEITDVNNAYIKQGSLFSYMLDGFWSDAGTFESLFRSSAHKAQTCGIDTNSIFEEIKTRPLTKEQKRLNQLIVSPVSSENSVGGIERYIDNFVRYAQKSQNNTYLLLPSSDKPEQEKIGNLQIHRCEFLKLDSKELFAGKRLSHSQVGKKSKDFFEFLLNFISKNDISIVNAQGFEFLYPKFNIALQMACFSRNIPSVLQVHTFPSKEIEKAMVFDMPWKKILAISKSVAGDLFAKGLNVEKIDTVYLGVDTKVFFQNKDPLWQRTNVNFPPDSKIILHASRITDGVKPILKEKGIITLLEAFSKLNHDYPNYRLLFATGIPPADLKEEFDYSLEQLNSYAKLLNIEEKIITKPFRLEEMPKVYNSADVFVMASENETLGQVFLEAMACGVPVIGTNVGGVPEIINDNENGFLVEPKDASNLSQKIVEILENGELRRSFVESGLKTIEENFSAENQFGKLFLSLQDIINTDC